MNEIAHSKNAPAKNGKKAHSSASLTQHKKKAKDMGERGYDEEVYDMAHNMVSAINGQERQAEPFIPNGSLNDWDSFA